MDLIAMRTGNYPQGLRDLISTNFPESRNLIGIEIGSYQGESAEIFLSTGRFCRIYCIDAWRNGYDDNDIASPTVELAEKAFDRRLGNDARIVKIKGFSYNVAKLIPDGIADFLYVDGCHTKEAVSNDLAMYFSKVKDGGVISGHDYDPRDWNGVVEAVDEFLGRKPERTFCDTSWSNKKQ